MRGAASAAAALIGTKKDNESCFPTLTFKQRMYGFLGCFISGLVIDFISFGGLFSMFAGHPTKFAITYSLGNIIALMGTSFLIGPMRQFRNMTDPTRLVTTIVFFLALIGTLVTALTLKQPLVTLIFIIIQFAAFIWYCLSYIPFARALVKRCFRKAASSDDA